MSEATSGDAQDSYKRSEGQKKSFLGKFNTRLQDAIQQGRGEEAVRQSVVRVENERAVPADDMAVRSAQTLNLNRMIVPDGVLIEGAMTSSSETQIAGRVNGDVTVESILGLEPTAVINGKVHAVSCTVQGKVDGNLETKHDLVIGESGVVRANAMSGKDMTIAGRIKGNVKCGGLLRLMKTARLDGNVRTRSIVINEGAIFNGTCSMAAQKSAGDPKK